MALGFVFFFFFKQKTAYEIMPSLVGSEMCIRDSREHVYVKVVDYKSGSREFSLAALYYGLQLQLVVYMNAAMEIAGKKHPEKEIVPAAMLYYRVQDPMIEMPEGEPSAEEVNAQVLRALRTTGIVNAREDVVDGLDQGFLGRSDVVPLERKKDGSFSARSSVFCLLYTSPSPRD